MPVICLQRPFSSQTAQLKGNGQSRALVRQQAVDCCSQLVMSSVPGLQALVRHYTAILPERIRTACFFIPSRMSIIGI